jgi:CubicO group peptidase (beta-lactamase class C family)
MKHIASAILILLSLSAVAFGAGSMAATDPESLGFSTTRLARIASWYQAHVEAGDLPGAVVAIARNGKLAYLNAIGFQDRGKTVPMNPDAIFWIASMTKPVTSVAAMMLVEKGKLDLDAPVSPVLAGPQGHASREGSGRPGNGRDDQLYVGARAAKAPNDRTGFASPHIRPRISAPI